MGTVKPKQQRSIETKNNILDAAIKVFAQKGPDGTRIDDIEKTAGVNKQRIYAYFGSKERLYRQVLLNVYSKAAANDNITNITEKDIPRMTEITINAFFEFHRQNPLFWRLLAWENLNGGKNLSTDDWINIQSSYIEHLRRLYTTGQEKGIFSDQISFSTYIITIFSVSFFYYSNQITISNLLSLHLEEKNVQSVFADEVARILTKGTGHTSL